MVDIVDHESCIEGLVAEIKAELFSPSSDLYSLLSLSAYDTAWVAMIPDPQNPKRPMFPGCLDWVLASQSSEGGFWGGTDATVQCLANTIACIVALKTWNVGTCNIERGLLFLRRNMEKLLMSAITDEGTGIILPGMIELAQARGLEVLPAEGYADATNDLFLQREHILGNMNQNSSSTCRPYLGRELYLEALPDRYKTKQELMILRDQFGGLEFPSPSAAACAFMITGDQDCLKFLKTVVQRCGYGVSPIYPIAEDLIRLCLVDHLEKLGCREHFEAEISDVMERAYRNWMDGQPHVRQQDVRQQIYQDAFTFRVLRQHGYRVSPRRFCWFVHDQEMLSHMEEKYNHHLGAMYEVYKATHLMFPEEDDLQKAKYICRKILQNSLSCDSSKVRAYTLDNIHSEIEHEINLPWLERMDHLEHKQYIEANRGCILWLGKVSKFRLSIPSSVIELATNNFMLRQSIYRTELEELKRWSRDTGLSNMGFGREKTTYSYLLASSAICLPLKSNFRIVLAKSGILITVANDFFDEIGSLDELYCLTEATRRWENKGLSGHAKVIFDALDELVDDVTFKSLDSQFGIKQSLRDIWREIFNSWLKESIWSRSKHAPTINEYLDVGMVSIAIQALVFPLCYLMCPKFQDYSTSTRYNTITKLLMLSTRLLNDVQSYQREVKEGKLNMVLLYLKENQEEDVKSSICHIKNTLNIKEKVLLELLLNDDGIIIPKEWKLIHLLILKIFYMIYNSANAYDSPTALLDDVSKAIYEPLELKGLNTLF